MLVLCACGDDLHRKPRTGAFEYLLERFFPNETIDFEESFYCGDAAGRPKAPGWKKDFSASDFKFALNAGLPFFTPEQFFLKSKQNLHTDAKIRTLGYDPRQLLTAGTSQNIDIRETDEIEMVVMVGSPASGKSTFCMNYFPTYTRINQDTLKTFAKCVQVCEQSIKSNASIIIDSTNKDVPVRRKWIEIAKKHSIPVRCFYLNVEKDLTFHLNNFRKLNPSTPEIDRRSVPTVAIHMFFKNMTIPTVEEGFDEVKKVGFITKKNFSAAEKKLFTSFLS